jgi:LuxR family maltose regulon positive regulatory protein
MSIPLLATKLYLPPYRPNLVTRPRLLQKLDESLRMGSRLILLSAPAGFGKTTLVTEWIDTLNAASADGKAAQLAVKIAWLSLDEGDNDLATFLAYLVAALQTAAPGAGEATRKMLESGPLPAADALLLPLVNDLAGLSAPLVLVLDDYHEIQLPAIHEAMAFLIERHPPKMEIIITTRQDPLLPLTRWRARGLLAEIRLKDLRFTEQEAAEFLNRTMGLSLQAEDIAILENRTEGWIAGLQLAAVSLQQSSGGCGECASDFIQSFTGNDRYIMDYLVDEALCCLTVPVVSFLLNTSILERFNAALCQAVLQSAVPWDGKSHPPGEPEPAAALLDYLDRSNLFLIPLDNRREWYRYPHTSAPRGALVCG